MSRGEGFLCTLLIGACCAPIRGPAVARRFQAPTVRRRVAQQVEQPLTAFVGQVRRQSVIVAGGCHANSEHARVGDAASQRSSVTPALVRCAHGPLGPRPR